MWAIFFFVAVAKAAKLILFFDRRGKLLKKNTKQKDILTWVQVLPSLCLSWSYPVQIHKTQIKQNRTTDFRLTHFNIRIRTMKWVLHNHSFPIAFFFQGNVKHARWLTVTSSAEHASVDHPGTSTRGCAKVVQPEPLKAVKGGDKQIK